MNVSAVHLFYDTYMGWGHETLKTIVSKQAKRKLQKGEVAIFLNKKWTGIKVLAPNGALIYMRSATPFTVEVVRYLPTAFGSGRITFSSNLENTLVKSFEDRFGKQMKRMKVTYA